MKKKKKKGNYLLNILFSWELIGRDKISPSKDAASCPEFKEARDKTPSCLFPLQQWLVKSD